MGKMSLKKGRREFKSLHKLLFTSIEINLRANDKVSKETTFASSSHVYVTFPRIYANIFIQFTKNMFHYLLNLHIKTKGQELSFPITRAVLIPKW